jgi:hypothetical protein
LLKHDRDRLRLAKREAVMPLTGRFDFKKTFSGKLVLLLEEDVRAFWLPFRTRATRRRWRRAKVMDLASPELRPLIDLRSRPNYYVPHRGLDQPAARLNQTVEQAAVAAQASAS